MTNERQAGREYAFDATIESGRRGGVLVRVPFGVRRERAVERLAGGDARGRP